jgi:hypothetical protein
MKTNKNSKITKHFKEVYEVLATRIKRTDIATLMGFTTTTQLENVLTGSALISTKAIQNLVERLKVNPAYLFTGSGNMFLPKEVPAKKTKTKYKIWVEIERIENAGTGNETYANEDNPVGIAYRNSIEDAVQLQTLINNTFGEIM